MRGGGGAHFGVAPRHIGGLQVGKVDGFKAVGRAERYRLRFACIRVGDGLFAPPAFLLQHGCKFALEVAQGLPCFGGFEYGLVDVVSHVHFGGFGDGKGGDMGIVQHILPVPTFGNALLFQVSDGVFRLHLEQHGDFVFVHGLRFPQLRLRFQPPDHIGKKDEPRQLVLHGGVV